MPISSAASFFTPPALSSARRMVSRSTHSMFWRSFSDGSPVVCGAGALDGVFKLSHVARPVVLLQSGQPALVDPFDAAPGALRVFLDEMLDQRRNVVPAIAQRWNLDRNHVEPVEEILLEPAVGHH